MARWRAILPCPDRFSRPPTCLVASARNPAGFSDLPRRAGGQREQLIQSTAFASGDHAAQPAKGRVCLPASVADLDEGRRKRDGRWQDRPPFVAPNRVTASICDGQNKVGGFVARTQARGRRFHDRGDRRADSGFDGVGKQRFGSCSLEAGKRAQSLARLR